jgi:sensor histidine kinase YesM
MPALPAPIDRHRAHPWRAMAWRGVGTQLACGLIALLFWLLSAHGSFGYNAVYSFAIGNCCWLFIDGARALIARRLLGPGGEGEWPGWNWMGPVVLLATVAGYSLGSSLADALVGSRSSGLLANRPAMVASIVAAIAISYYFYARETLQKRRLAAEAAQRLAAETQLKLLRSQLEPHMLFNTLANLRVLIGADPARAQAMLDQLIVFLRATLASSREQRHALAAEFDSLRAYLDLMAVRMGPRLAVQFELPLALRDAPVPPLLLQPLVENGIRHGLEPSVAGGVIRVSAERDGDELVLRVRDSGVGLGEAAASTGAGFGLQQVRHRLASLYGEQASLDVHAAGDAAGGTEAAVRLPLQQGPVVAAAAR